MSLFGKKKDSPDDDNYASGYYTGFVEVGKEGVMPSSTEWEDGALDADEHARHDDPDESHPFFKWMRGCADGVTYARDARKNENIYKGG